MILYSIQVGRFLFLGISHRKNSTVSRLLASLIYPMINPDKSAGILYNPRII
jgi:hypothetical protein